MFWCDDSNEGKQPYAYFKSAHFATYIGSILIDFHKTSVTRILFYEIFEMRGNSLMLTSKLYVFLLISWFNADFHKASVTEILLMTIVMRGNNPMLPSKLHILINILAPYWLIVIRPLLEGFFFMTQLKWGETTLC